MNVVLLAGGKGTRIAEETETIPKVMVDIGGRPILWHIMRHYAHHGFREIFVALGHKGHIIRRYFTDLFVSAGSRVSLDFAGSSATLEPMASAGSIVATEAAHLGLRIHLVDTGEETATGGRLLRLRRWLQEEPFMVTYGDGVSDIDLRALRDFHTSHGRVATLSAVQPPPRFGRLVCEGDLVTRFAEKPSLHSPAQAAGAAPTPPAWQDWINGGFFVFEPALFDLIRDDRDSLEADVLPRLSAAGRLVAYRHRGFWQCMDTVHDKRLLQELWDSGAPPWRVWND